MISLVGIFDFLKMLVSTLENSAQFCVIHIFTIVFMINLGDHVCLEVRLVLLQTKAFYRTDIFKLNILLVPS